MNLQDSSDVIFNKAHEEKNVYNLDNIMSLDLMNMGGAE